MAPTYEVFPVWIPRFRLTVSLWSTRRYTSVIRVMKTVRFAMRRKTSMLSRACQRLDSVQLILKMKEILGAEKRFVRTVCLDPNLEVDLHNTGP